MASNDTGGEQGNEPRRLSTSGADSWQNIVGRSAGLRLIPSYLQPGIPAWSVPGISTGIRENLIEQLRPIAGAAWRSALDDPAVRAWREQSKPAAREEQTPRKFLTANAIEVSTVQKFTSALAKMSPRHLDHGLVWRGQSNADWPIRSTLSRAIIQHNDNDVATEDDLIAAETNILDSVRNWGLGLSDLPPGMMDVFAELKHAGAPTRLLDVTRDPNIAAWFAVNDNPNKDALLIAWGQHPQTRDDAQKPKSTGEILDQAGDGLIWHGFNEEQRRYFGWGTGERTHVWFPPSPNRRMRVQRGGFIVESGPMFMEPILQTINEELSKSTGEPQDWRRSELEQVTTVVGLPSPIAKKTKPNKSALVPIFTILIKAEAKTGVLEHLRAHGIETRTMYPDLPGLVTQLRREYPTG